MGHATNHPAAGEDLTARLLAVLADPKNAKVYAKTAFILNYDEGGQFFDHLWTPTVPVSTTDGKSTVETTGEITKEIEVGVPAGTPIGMGFRVPLIVVSPWSRAKGGAVYSQVVDHTSQIMFVEKRFNVSCPNISPWRRAVAGDLTAAFDFASPPDYSWPTLPDTSGYVAAADRECSLPAPEVPVKQSMPTQEPGTKKSLALPYSFRLTDHVTGTGVDKHELRLSIANTGQAGACFSVFDYASQAEAGGGAPRKYTVEAGKNLNDTWAVAGRAFNLSAFGPNGFVRSYTGDGSPGGSASVDMIEHTHNDSISFFLGLRGSSGREEESCSAVSFDITDESYGAGGPWVLVADHHAPMHVHTMSTASSGNWYDLTVAARSLCKGKQLEFVRRFMGRMETGKHTITDPAMATQPASSQRIHLDVPEYHRSFDKTVRRGQVESSVVQGHVDVGKFQCPNGNKDSCTYLNTTSYEPH